ncbi:hypothetical protein MnTg04_00213 [bacterium MnTg04]|nr:hypothetical protein MnTg04_00213 [bacterium MnTg04]
MLPDPNQFEAGFRVEPRFHRHRAMIIGSCCTGGQQTDKRKQPDNF